MFFFSITAFCTNLEVHVSPQEERINKTVVKTTAGNMHEVNPLRSMKLFCKQKGQLALVNIITQEKKG